MASLFGNSNAFNLSSIQAQIRGLTLKTNVNQSDIQTIQNPNIRKLYLDIQVGIEGSSEGLQNIKLWSGSQPGDHIGIHGFISGQSSTDNSVRSHMTLGTTFYHPTDDTTIQRDDYAVQIAGSTTQLAHVRFGSLTSEGTCRLIITAENDAPIMNYKVSLEVIGDLANISFDV